MTASVEAPGGAVRVLLVDDDEDDFILTRDLLADLGPGAYRLDWVPTYEAALEAIRSARHDVYLLDFNLGARNGLELLEEAVTGGCDAPLILLTGQGHRSIDMEAMRAGAADYLPKAHMDAAQLERVIRFALERKRNEDTLLRLRDELEARVVARTAELARANDQLRGEIAERRAAEEERARLLALEREARAEAEAANRAKDRLLATLSHELRTPLNPILLATSSLERDPALPESLLPTIAMIRRNVELESRLIDDLLDSTRIARGVLIVRRRAIDAHGVVRAALEICAPDIEAAGLHLECALGAGAHHVEADGARLQQLLWNLLKNAVKFTPRGGRVRVATRNGADGEGPPGSFLLEVSDTGIGIEPEALRRIFEPFEQAGEVVRRRFGGLGLGLSIARAVAEAHGGSLRAESDGPGLGARFLLRLDLAPRPAAEADGKPAVPSSAVGPRQVLLVEDDPSSLRVLGRLLRADGHRVVEADCAAAALDAAGRGTFDLLVSDLGLPDGSGLDLIRRLRPLGPFRAIALTGYGTQEDVARARAAGFDEHLTKPITMDGLREVIARLATRG